MLQPFALKSRLRPVTKNLGQKVELAMVNHLIKTHKKHGIILNEEAKRLLGLTQARAVQLAKDPPKKKWSTLAILKHHAAVKIDPTIKNLAE